MKEKIDPNILIDVAAALISDKEPTTRVGRWLRWIEKLNQIRNNIGLKIKPR
jgi:hypothetical protein